MNDGAGVIAIEMPYRPEDAAIVPVTLRTELPPSDTRRVLANHACDRPEPRSDGGAFRAGTGFFRIANLHTRAGQ